MKYNNEHGRKAFYHYVLIALITALFANCQSHPKVNHLDLSGIWQFKIDTADLGLQEKWCQLNFDETVNLPGSMRDNNKGFKPTLNTEWTGSIYDSSWYFNPALEKYRTKEPLKFPFWLTPNLHYVGAAWYQKILTISNNWIDDPVFIYLERPHWETTIWIDTVMVAHQNSLSTPHLAELSKYLKVGENKITVRVDNRLDEVNVGPDSHSVTDHTQGNWNGIIGEIKLIRKPKVSFQQVQLFPNFDNKEVMARFIIYNSNKYKGKAKLKFRAVNANNPKQNLTKTVQQTIQLSKLIDTIEVILPLGKNMLIWDEFTPNRYNFQATIHTANSQSDSISSTFGMRKISTSGKQILVNHKPVYLRGNVDCCVFPLTGYPPTDVHTWLKILKKTKDYGFNHVRFHSWCPPEAAFEAADQLGIYLQPEGPSWANHGTNLGTGRPVDQYIYDESERIVNTYGNHPSFCFYAYGNEPRGNYVNYLNDFLIYWKQKDDRRIYTGASIGGSWNHCSENQFHVKGGARGLPWKNQPNSTFNYEQNIAWSQVPFITHELGQYCVYPNFAEIQKYTGVYKALNFELFRDLLKNNHMEDQAEQFLLASGELQKLCYKYELEASLRTKGMSGYQMLQLNDFPGQGTALVGLLDAFFDEKGYVSAKEFNEFCSPVTIMATLPKFVFLNNEEFSAGIELANYGAKPLKNDTLKWQVMNAINKTIKSGELYISEYAVGEVGELDKIGFPLNEITKAEKLTLKCTLGNSVNHWDFWVYPEKLPQLPNRVYVTNVINENAISTLKKGGDVLLLAAGKIENGKDVVQYFTPVFWNTSWFKMRPPHTTGVLIKNNHPVFTDFPTSFHSDLQWWELVNRQQVMNLENFPTNFRPLVQPIDTWFLNRRLALLFEAKVENGRIIVCSADLTSEPNSRPVARQLLFSIEQYMNSNEFQPEHNIELTVIQELFEKKNRALINMYTKESPDELKPEHAKKNKNQNDD